MVEWGLKLLAEKGKFYLASKHGSVSHRKFQRLVERRFFLQLADKQRTATDGIIRLVVKFAPQQVYPYLFMPNGGPGDCWRCLLTLGEVEIILKVDNDVMELPRALSVVQYLTRCPSKLNFSVMVNRSNLKILFCNCLHCRF